MQIKDQASRSRARPGKGPSWWKRRRNAGLALSWQLRPSLDPCARALSLLQYPGEPVGSPKVAALGLRDRDFMNNDKALPHSSQPFLPEPPCHTPR